MVREKKEPREAPFSCTYFYIGRLRSAIAMHTAAPPHVIERPRIMKMIAPVDMVFLLFALLVD